MSLERCNSCKEFIAGSHRCAPGWLIWRPEYGSTEEDARTFYSMNPEIAVEKWAEWSDQHSADYDIVNGCPATVHVRLQDKDINRAELLCLPTEELVFEVYGETVPSYTAYIKTPRR